MKCRTFMAMNRGLLAFPIPGDDQKFESEIYGLEAGRDRTRYFRAGIGFPPNSFMASPCLPSCELWSMIKMILRPILGPWPSDEPMKRQSGRLVHDICVVCFRQITGVTFSSREFTH